MGARTVCLRDAAKALVRWWTGSAGASCGALKTSWALKKRRANVIAVDDVHKQRWTWMETRSSDSTSTLVPHRGMAYGARRAPSGSGSKANARAELRNTILETAVGGWCKPWDPGSVGADSWRCRCRRGGRVLSTRYQVSTIPPPRAIHVLL
jgi:hypothetical protein